MEMNVFGSCVLIHMTPVPDPLLSHAFQNRLDKGGTTRSSGRPLHSLVSWVL